MDQKYRQQVSLVLDVLPEVASEDCFALHGGTAINLFLRDMPRLSVDIDLTYVPIEDRQTSLLKIRAALIRIKERVERIFPNLRVVDRSDIGKLLISADGSVTKLEVNLVNRGTIASPVSETLCHSAQEEFDAFCEISIVPPGQLYGGKICAALDRQHPRDLFDVKYLLETEGFSDHIKAGFLFALLSSDRPLHELLDPTMLDQRMVFGRHFDGMTLEEFGYEEFEQIRSNLVETMHASLTNKDREFILSISRLDPRWDAYDFKDFPSVQWKLRNIQRLFETNAAKYADQLARLERVLISTA